MRSGCFSVPMHQRYYDWDGEHVDTLLFDLAEAVDDKSPCHFLGSIMLITKGTENHWEINDGQQRVITFSLICAYLCRSFHEAGCSSEENNILRILFNIDEGHRETFDSVENLSPRITPPRANKVNFNNLIRGHDLNRNGKMIDAWKKIGEFFENQSRQNLAWRSQVLGYLLNNFIVIRLEVQESLDSNAIFETLNYRGKYLEQVDLLKNYFLSFFNKPADAVRCDTMNDCFEKIYVSVPTAVSEYVRCYMQVKYGFINKERFFRDIKKRFRNTTRRNSNKVYNLVLKLAEGEGVQIFKILLRKSTGQEVLNKLTNDAKKARNKRKIGDYLLDLHDYKIVRPIVFALFYRYCKSSNDEKFKSAKFVYACTKILASFVQRTSHIGNFKPSAYEENLQI